ncbi:hypothetical protein [Amycolatopsis sp. NPDC057786]|uniref:hypothetical protein n=1 Tax=Amycolatopsis sp. NPDC057786 TaxID=3346250 RepID=UPI00366C0080
MGIHVVIQPLVGYGAAVVSPSPGVRQLVAGSEETSFIVQVPARIGGLMDTARFAQSLAAAASEFSEWCETQHRTRSHTSSFHDQWSDAADDAVTRKND